MGKKWDWAESYLGGVRALRYKLRYLDGKIKNLADEIYSRGGIEYGERVQTSARGDSLERSVIQYVDELTKLQHEYEAQYISLQKRQDEAFNRIDLMNDGRLKDFLMRFYIDGVSEVEYASNAGYIDFNTVYKVKDRALKYFTELAESEGWKKSNRV